jgi:hypothetical protein
MKKFWFEVTVVKQLHLHFSQIPNVIVGASSQICSIINKDLGKPAPTDSGQRENIAERNPVHDFLSLVINPSTVCFDHQRSQLK